MLHDTKKLHFILEKIEDIDSFKNRFNSINELFDDKIGFDTTLMCLLQTEED